MQTNGTHHKNGATRPVDPDKPAYALRVFRVEKGQRVFVRTLGDSYGGLFTHYRGRSIYCPGEGCPSQMHNFPKIWKGYAAVEFWDEARKLWFPFVLEITEHLELDFRNIYARGQVWEVYRDEAKKAGSPVRAVLHPDTLDLSKLPPPFDYIPVLKAMYHWTSMLPVDVKNPMPPRVIVQPTADEAPTAFRQSTGDDGPPLDAAEKMRIYEAARARHAEKMRSKGK